MINIEKDNCLLLTLLTPSRISPKRFVHNSLHNGCAAQPQNTGQQEPHKSPTGTRTACFLWLYRSTSLPLW